MRYIHGSKTKGRGYAQRRAKESRRWKEIVARDREKLVKGIRRKYREETEFANAKAADMRKKGGDEARKKITERRTALLNLAKECECETIIMCPWEQQDKIEIYLKKLKALRDKMKAEEEESS